MTKPSLSKSKILSGLQCHKRLWLEVHNPSVRTQDPNLEARLDAGTDAGVIARREWPDGVLASEQDFAQAVVDTQTWLENPSLPLFEGFFSFEGVRVRPDVLVPKVDGSIDLYEVKSSTSVKPYHESDVTVQTWVLRGLGLNVSHVFLSRIDNSFVYAGNDDYKGLFLHEELTQQANTGSDDVERWIHEFRGVLTGSEPAIGIGPHCRDPFECPFIPHCSVGEPEFPVENLPKNAGKTLAKSSQAVTNPAAGEQLRSYGWPRYFLDFETVNPAVPVWAGTRPYERIPFQWSCHIAVNGYDKLRHLEFLARPDAHPAASFARTLVQAVGDSSGPIFVYNIGFERSIVLALADCLPALSVELRDVAGRMVDLLPLTEESWYHPEMKGSWSLKRVLPTIPAGFDYADLDGVSDGQGASTAIAEYCRPDIDSERREELSALLKRYCMMDTLATVRLAQHLESL